MEISQNLCIGSSIPKNETDLIYMYKINSCINLKIGNCINYDEYTVVKFSIGAGYKIPLKNYHFGFYQIEAFSLMSYPYDALFLPLPFSWYNVDIGAKFIYKELFFIDLGLKYYHDKWFHYSDSFGFFAGFGLIIDFKLRSRHL